MAIVLISSRFEGGGADLAQSLARKTNWPLIDRQEMQELARTQGIRTGRIEMSIIKAPGISERIARETKLYLAFLTATLCEKARDGNLIYCGRTGHLLLPGISHRLRVGLTAPHEVRVERTARTLNLSMDRAEVYLRALDQDFDRWLRVIHRVEGHDLNQYDVCFNLDQLGLSNAAGVVCEMAQLTDFKPTPVSKKLMQDMHLTARANLRLAFDQRTAAAELQAQADDGVLTVTYPPQWESVAESVPKVLADLDGCRRIQCTMAETNILWVQERFDPSSEGFHHLTRLAQRWGAAVELMRLVPHGDPIEEAVSVAQPVEMLRPRTNNDGGVEDDPPQPVVDDGGLDSTEEELVSLGRSAGQCTVSGGYDRILEVARDKGKYSLVVLGNIFLSKGDSARTRMTRELAMSIRDRLKAPVITISELESRFMFGRKQAAKMLTFLALVVAIYLSVFAFQEPVLSFLGGPLHQRFKLLTPIGVALVVPLVAYLYGAVTGLALKLINID